MTPNKKFSLLRLCRLNLRDKNWWRVTLIWVITMLLRYGLSCLVLATVLSPAQAQPAKGGHNPFSCTGSLNNTIAVSSAR